MGSDTTAGSRSAKKKKRGKSRRIVATHNVFESWATIGSKKNNGEVGRRSRWSVLVTHLIGEKNLSWNMPYDIISVFKAPRYLALQ